MKLIKLTTQSPSKVIWINPEYIISLEEVKNDQCTYIQTVNGIHYVDEPVVEIMRLVAQFMWPDQR